MWRIQSLPLIPPRDHRQQPLQHQISFAPRDGGEQETLATLLHSSACLGTMPRRLDNIES